MKKMGYARTQAGAKRRSAMKRALRRLEIEMDGDITTRKLENLYRKHIQKAPPSIEKYK